MDSQQEYWAAVSEELKAIGIYSPELVTGLKEALQKGAALFPFHKRVMSEQDVIDYGMTFNLNPAKGLIILDKYSASLRITGPIGQQVIDGINIKDLDARLASHPWDKGDALAGIDGLLLKGLGEVARTASELYNLITSENPQARDAGERLAARYWLGTPMENVVDLTAAAARFERKQDFTLDPSEMTINVNKAYQLLSGGSVATLSEYLEPSWAYIDFSAPEGSSMIYVRDLYLMELLKGLPLKELQKEATCIELVAGLMEGKKMPVHVESEQGVLPASLQVNAAEKKLVLRDPNGETFSLEATRRQEPAIWEKVKMKDFPQLPGGAEVKKKGIGI